MSDDTYEGWANRETWAVTLHINNDQGWQESVHEALRAKRVTDVRWAELVTEDERARTAGEIIRENVEERLNGRTIEIRETGRPMWSALSTLRDIGSLWRVDWTELGAAFLADLES